jgi:hypothetical protein
VSARTAVVGPERTAGSLLPTAGAIVLLAITLAELVPGVPASRDRRVS